MIKIILKLIISISLVIFLVKRGTLDFTLALQLKNHPLLILQTLILMAIPFVTTAFRWKQILEIKTQESLPLKKIISLTWIGQFFSTILPGGVTGDLIKIIYAKTLHSSLTKGFLLISAFIDRIFGLIGLLIIQGVVCLILFKPLTALSPKIAPLLYFNFLLFIGVILFIATMFLKQSWQNKILSIITRIPKIGVPLHKALDNFWLIGSCRRVFFSNLVITIVTQILIIFVFYSLIKPFLPAPLPISYAFAFIPLGLISVMIPISPMGLGVGHAMFQQLFSYFHINNGATLFNLFFIFNVTINLIGGIPYIFYRDQLPLREAEEPITNI